MIITSDGNIPSRFAHSFNVTKMAQGFLDSGLDVTLLSLFSFPNFIERLKICDIYDYYAIDKKIKLKFLPVYNRDIFTKTIGANGFNLQAAQYIKKVNPDFVYCRSYLTPYYCVRFKVPTILETHTTIYDHPDLQKIYSIAKDPYFLGLVTIHENIKKEHMKRGIPEDKILVLEDGVDLKRFDINDDKRYWRKQLELPEDRKIVLYCGSLYKDKGIQDILLTAQKLVLRKDILFILVGGRSQEIDEWENYCEKNSITNVIFTGFTKNSNVPRYLKAADVLIMPYSMKTDFNVMDIHSTSPLKLFEYMASRRPIISTNIPVISKIVTHNKSVMLAEANNINMLVDFITELLENPSKSEMISNNAYEITKEYEWEKRCQIIISHFVLPNKAGAFVSE